MTGQIGIIRNATVEEKKDFVELGKPGTLNLFLKEVSKIQNDFQKKFKPYDASCARTDFEFELERVSEETRLNPEAATSMFNKIDLDAYGKDSWFDYIGEESVSEDKLIDSMRQSMKIGVYRNYKCKKRGHGFSIFVPIEEVEKEKKVVEKKE